MFAGRSLSRLVRTVVAGALVALSIFAALAGNASKASAASGPNLTSKDLLVGGFFAPAPGSAWLKADQIAAIENSEQSFGRKYDLVQSYYPFATAFPTWRETYNISMGRTPVIGWNGIKDVDSVASGAYDAMIHTRARDVKALGAPVVIRFAWEMDGAANPVKPNNAPGYVAQWRRIHSIFAQEGATNVIWMWCPNAWGIDNGSAQPFYPGDDVVDWIGADGYDFAPVKPKAKHATFEAIFAKSYDYAKAHNKPFTIGEFGALEDTAISGYKAQWLDAARTALTGRLAGTKAILAWSHQDGTYDDPSTMYNFRFDSSPAVTAAWARWSTATNGSNTTVTPATDPQPPTAGQVIRPRADRQVGGRPPRALVRRIAA
jgi:hypothetical protein